MSNLWVLPEELGDQADSEYAYEAAKSASQLLWGLSGRKFGGVTTVTERYIRSIPGGDLGMSVNSVSPQMIAGDVYTTTTDADGWISPNGRIRLRGRPVNEIFAIRTFDGTIVDPSEYYLVDHSTVQFVNGAIFAPYNIEITYSYGVPAPTMGKMAARMLAIEFAKLWAGDEDCALPQRVMSITRQGISMTILDNQAFLDDMRTGVYTVDLFLKSVNPDSARAKSRVFSPDRPRARRYTPKPLENTVSARDITIIRGNDGVTTIPLADIGATLLEDPTWVPDLILRNYGASKSLDLGSEAAIVDTIGESITLTVPYNRAVTVLLMVDSGTYDLYATKNGNTVYITSGNLRITMAG